MLTQCVYAHQLLKLYFQQKGEDIDDDDEDGDTDTKYSELERRNDEEKSTDIIIIMWLSCDYHVTNLLSCDIRSTQSTGIPLVGSLWWTLPWLSIMKFELKLFNKDCLII